MLFRQSVPTFTKKFKNVPVPYLWWLSVPKVAVLVRVSFADLVVECGAGGRPGEGVSY